MNAIDFAGVSLKEAIDMTSRNPAKILGYETVRLRRGALADLIVFRMSQVRKRLDIEATIGSGQLMFGEIVLR